MQNVDAGFLVIVNIVFPDQAFAILQTNYTRAFPAVHFVVLYDWIGVRTNIDTYGSSSNKKELQAGYLRVIFCKLVKAKAEKHNTIHYKISNTGITTLNSIQRRAQAILYIDTPRQF